MRGGNNLDDEKLSRTYSKRQTGTQFWRKIEMKNNYLLLSLLILVSLILTACGGATETPTEALPEPTEPPVVEEEVIECMGGEGSEISMLATPAI
jgi:hypothetical protein